MIPSFSVCAFFFSQTRWSKYSDDQCTLYSDGPICRRLKSIIYGFPALARSPCKTEAHVLFFFRILFFLLLLSSFDLLFFFVPTFLFPLPFFGLLLYLLNTLLCPRFFRICPAYFSKDETSDDAIHKSLEAAESVASACLTALLDKCVQNLLPFIIKLSWAYFIFLDSALEFVLYFPPTPLKKNPLFLYLFLTFFLIFIYYRASKKKEEVDFKMILDNLVSDLLTVYTHIELPAAELLLFQIVGILVRFLV